MSKQQLKEKGFTIIEVVLVLAIAALIFLMVFIALPALQRNQRDQDRKTTQSTVASSVTSYASNNRGVLPSNLSSFAGYVDANRDGIINEKYKVVLTDDENRKPADIESADYEEVIVIRGASCNDTNEAVSSTPRNAAVLMMMENGKQIVCTGV